jgi:dienelactone hydrolase
VVRYFVLFVSFAVIAACSLLPGPAARVATFVGGGGEFIRIPVTDEYGEAQSIAARVCRPAGEAPAPVAVLAHGLPPVGESRADMSPASCAEPSVRWFRDHGYVVVLALRRGYGDSRGGWAEDPGACASPDYAHSGLEGARDLDAILAFAVHQPWAKPEDAVIVGEDAGGWAVIAYASQTHDVAARLIDMAGVQGARTASDLGHICRPDLLVEAAASFGATAHTPMLWVYPSNDRVIPGPVTAALHNAFVHAGGRAELVQPGVPSLDGHDVLFESDGPAIWGDLVGFFLSR